MKNISNGKSIILLCNYKMASDSNRFEELRRFNHNPNLANLTCYTRGIRGGGAVGECQFRDTGDPNNQYHCVRMQEHHVNVVHNGNEYRLCTNCEDFTHCGFGVITQEDGRESMGGGCTVCNFQI